MAGRKSTRRLVAPRNPLADSSARKRDTDPAMRDASLVLAIEAQRRRLFQVSAIAACLGHSLVEACARCPMASELQNVTDAMIQLLDDAAAGLDPTVLNLPALPMIQRPSEA
jgi:hypothetical protein